MSQTRRNEGLTLTGLDGSNPLAFLSALGTVRVLSQVWCERNVRLSWQRTDAWRPVLCGDGIGTDTKQALCETIESSLSVPHPGTNDDTKTSERAFRDARKRFDREVKRIRSEVKAEGLKGKKAKNALNRRISEELRELEQEVTALKSRWYQAIESSAPATHVSLGQDLSVTSTRFRRFAASAVEAAKRKERAWADFTASYGCDSLTQPKQNRIQATQFCFITGSGRQWYLETMTKLMRQCGVEHFLEALFGPWKYQDDRLGMRWDPADVHEYALEWRNPSESTPKTVWGANRLAIEALAFYPTIPRGRRLATTGWVRRQKTDVFRWPIWECPVGAETLRSLVALSDLNRQRPDRQRLQAMGIAEVFESRRIELGNPPLVKISFSRSSPA